MIPDGAGCAALGYSQDISVMATGAGTCHVEVTFENGATSSVDLDFTSRWFGCGSDPQGCGEGFVATATDGGPTFVVSVPGAVCASGLDAGAPD
jgi:hypothetical protein